MSDFNPFNKLFREIQAKDLLKLREVEEGWYVEYKREVTNPSSIAKAISSFSNQYGGWIFFGIDQTKVGPKVAGGFPGISSKEVQTLCERIRSAVIGNVQPVPHFETRILEGPCPEIGLGGNQCIIMIFVPLGPDSPYIHSSGKIYRRQADSSEPKPEADRAVLDQLWERNQRNRARFAEFLEKIPPICEDEKEKPILHVYLFSDPLQDRGHLLNFSFKRYTELMQSTKIEDGGIPFDNFFTMTDGFVARQVAINDPYFLQMTWRHFEDNSVIFTLPLSAGRLNTDFKFYLSKRYRFTKDIMKKLNRGSIPSHSRLLDLNIVMITLTSVIQRYHCLSNEIGIEGPFYFKALLQNVLRCVPFIDSKIFKTFLDKYGIPIIQDTLLFSPAGKGPENLIRLQEHSEFTQIPQEMIPFLRAIPAIKAVFEALGILPIMIDQNIDTIIELYDASTRAIVQQNTT